MKAQDCLAEGILATKSLAARYFTGFSDDNRTRQAPSLPNHFAWNLGHLAITMHRATERLQGAQASGPLPPEDFIEGGTKSGGGDANRFASESVSFGSAPTDDPAHYPRFDRCIQIFNNACDRLAAAVRALPDSDLTTEVPWGMGMKITKHLMAQRMVFHNGDHVGQICDLRRAFGFPSAFS